MGEQEICPLYLIAGNADTQDKVVIGHNMNKLKGENFYRYCWLPILWYNRIKSYSMLLTCNNDYWCYFCNRREADDCIAANCPFDI